MTEIREEELNMVNGGFLGETRMDSIFLANNKDLKEDISISALVFGWGSNSAKVCEGWSKEGVTCEANFFSANHYSVNGEEITRSEALKMIGA